MYILSSKVILTQQEPGAAAGLKRAALLARFRVLSAKAPKLPRFHFHWDENL